MPLGLILGTLIDGGDFFPVGLVDLTSLLIAPADDGSIDPTVAPLLCTVTSGVNTILGLITGAGGNQECAAGNPGDFPLDPSALEDLLDLLGLEGALP